MSVAVAAVRFTLPPFNLQSGTLLRRFAALFGVMVEGATIVTGLMGVYSAFQDNRSAITQLQAEESSAAADRIDQFFQDTVAVIGATLPPSAAPRDLVQRRDDYLRVLRLAPAISGLTYVDATDLPEVRVSRVGLTQVGANQDVHAAPSSSATRVANQATSFSPPYFRNGTEPHMTIYYPEPAPDGGVTIADVNLTFIWELVSAIHVGRAGVAYVVDREGNLIAHPDISLVLRKTDLGALTQVHETVAGHQVAAMMTANLLGQHVIATSHVIPTTGWFVIVEQPADEALAGLFTSVARTMVLVAGSLIAGLLLSIVVARHIVRPIQAMQLSRERTEQELRIAREIQLALLPSGIPVLHGWRVKAHYEPAHQVGGDFYDCVPLPDGQLGLFIGDVSGEGIPAALGMAQTRTILRSVASTSPAEVLTRTNDLLCADTPSDMFATCVYAVLEPISGKVRYANAGHPSAFQWHAADGLITELRATGLPLGMLRGTTYDEHDGQLRPGDLVVSYTDGLIEAHNARREMFGVPRLTAMLDEHAREGTALVDSLLQHLAAFTGPKWDQEDDLTIVVLERRSDDDWQTILEFELASEAGNERVAMERVADSVRELGLPIERLERLKSALAEAVMNAIEHGNQFQADVPVSIRVGIASGHVSVQVTDRGAGGPALPTEEPDLHAKLKGEQSPRGWGTFLMRNLVDELLTSSEADHYTVELRMRIS